MNKQLTNKIGYSDLQSVLMEASKDFLKQDPENCPEYRSGFISGIEWTLKKLRKADLLSTKDLGEQRS